jgi:hypothetical protein
MKITSDQNNSDINVPLCVDLDGTLIRSDILWESFVPMIKRPILCLRTLWSLRLGKAAMKSVLADNIKINPEWLPYREDLLAFLKDEYTSGRKVYLATATHVSVAKSIAAHLGIFEGVIATDKDVNLGGEKKRQALEETFGYKNYDYIGDHFKDIPVFSGARYSMLVDPSSKLQKKTAKKATVPRIACASMVKKCVAWRTDGHSPYGDKFRRMDWCIVSFR